MSHLDSYILFNEYFGTAILAIAISFSYILDEQGNILGSSKFIFSAILFTSLAIMSPLGGTDYNPGVTFMKLITYKDKKKIKYINRIIFPSFIMQTLGSICGFLISYCFRNGFVFKLCIHRDSSPATAFFIEVFCTFFLYLICLILDDKEVNNSSVAMKLIITISAVLTGISLGGNISGAGMNPAIAFGANLVRFLITGDLSEFKDLWIYIIAPFISSYLASVFFIAVYKREEKASIVSNSKEF